MEDRWGVGPFIAYSRNNTDAFVAALAGRRLVSPSRMTAIIGRNVTMNCSLGSIDGPAGLAWHYPLNRMNLNMRLEYVVGHYHETWISPSVLQLTIVHVGLHDQGVYVCKSRRGDEVAVRLTVVGRLSLCHGGNGFHCGNGMCVFRHHRCDRIMNCPDGSDEIGCGELLCEVKSELRFTRLLTGKVVSFWGAFVHLIESFHVT